MMVFPCVEQEVPTGHFGGHRSERRGEESPPTVVRRLGSPGHPREQDGPPSPQPNVVSFRGAFAIQPAQERATCLPGHARSVMAASPLTGAAETPIAALPLAADSKVVGQHDAVRPQEAFIDKRGERMAQTGLLRPGEILAT